ncbi:MAG: IS66 family insertion sequence element accessory protein TnpB [Oscillospiraceae bacterium]|nr:IS66 family insertion sequence element accessory protein TnpB [Oscillospiraceae bacterium]
MEEKEEILRSWEEMIKSCKSSGLTVSEWCRENGINIKTYYRRMRKLRQAKEVHTIVPISMPTCKGEIKIQTAGFTLELPADIPAQTLCMVIGALKC